MMIEKRTDVPCPYDQSLQRYWDRRHALFHRFDEGIQIDAEGLHSTLPEIVLKQGLSQIKGQTVIDAFSGVGASSIALALLGKNVQSIEIDQSRHGMAKNNANVYGVSQRITYLHDNIFDALPHLKADAIFLDPPWGWPSRKKMVSYALNEFPIDIMPLLSIAFSQYSEVVLHVPKIFDERTLTQLQKPYQIINNVFEKNIISKMIYFYVDSSDEVENKPITRDNKTRHP